MASISRRAACFGDLRPPSRALKWRRLGTAYKCHLACLPLMRALRPRRSTSMAYITPRARYFSFSAIAHAAYQRAASMPRRIIGILSAEICLRPFSYYAPGHDAFQEMAVIVFSQQRFRFSRRPSIYDMRKNRGGMTSIACLQRRISRHRRRRARDITCRLGIDAMPASALGITCGSYG